MKIRTLDVILFSIGPVGSPITIIVVEVYD
ncbi:hypothetical protein [Brachyspira hyodysenteriae]|nr:hypothetical protein [Brachyspira hyodysenteriae]